MTPTLGVGVDAVEVPRFAAVLQRRPRLEARLFTDEERRDRGSPSARVRSLAARFAAKEATMKALGVGLGGCAFTEVEVTRVGTRPVLVLHGAAAARATALGVGQLLCSLTHTDSVAVAIVVAEEGR